MYYIAETDQLVAAPLMSDETYAEARRALPFVATDAVIFDASEKIIYLAWRRATPAQGWWTIGGGVKNGQDPDTAMAANFRRETSLDVDPDRFKLLHNAINVTQWTTQEQISNLHIPYGIELTPQELSVVQVNLDKKEYTAASGLRKFDLADLLHAITNGKGYPQPVLYYDMLFGTAGYDQALRLWKK